MLDPLFGISGPGPAGGLPASAALRGVGGVDELPGLLLLRLRAHHHRLPPPLQRLPGRLRRPPRAVRQHHAGTPASTNPARRCPTWQIGRGAVTWARQERRRLRVRNWG